MNKSFKLTEKGQKQLEAFKERQVKELLDDIIRVKDYPGVDEIEITANDIEECSRNWVYLRHNPKRSRFSMLKILSYAYWVIGIVMLIVSLFYDDLRSIYINNPQQISFMLIGACMSILGVVIHIYIRNVESHTKILNDHIIKL